MSSEIKSLHRGDYFGVEPLLERGGLTPTPTLTLTLTLTPIEGGIAVHYTNAVSVGTSEVSLTPPTPAR